MPLVEQRNAAWHHAKTRPSKSSKARFQRARAALREAVRDAKRVWLEARTTQMPTDCRHPGVWWQKCNELRQGLERSAPHVPLRFRGDDGALCTADEDNAEIARAHFHDVYNRRTNVDPSVLSMVRQREVKEELAAEPTAGEVAAQRSEGVFSDMRRLD